jgi:hypothetical protein
VPFSSSVSKTGDSRSELSLLYCEVEWYEIVLRCGGNMILRPIAGGGEEKRRLWGLVSKRVFRAIATREMVIQDPMIEGGRSGSAIKYHTHEHQKEVCKKSPSNIFRLGTPGTAPGNLCPGDPRLVFEKQTRSGKDCSSDGKTSAATKLVASISLG